ncbi:iron complex transport system permease protein [Kibdelosporangium banguiense]|uniref:Iron complex transport system permease protein n=1 Tax=Kibdelosporangium banguiense TaxID=1365924 RepID=A0ABS4T8S2_9PSEU|nr:iron chelate uptake ABC transporter family permease subunit [Kibdelosporangium banguiense]MBP2320246.1 iron complex transport system permease protein [Kibdelosporangium banguiense]
MTTHTITSARSSYRAIGLVGALVALIVVCLLSIWFGSKDIPFGATWDVLWHNDGSRDAAIIHSVRIPRTILGVLVGAALGLAGALMQALTRNPLADPGLLGVTAGASSAVVVGIAFLGVTGINGYVWFAFIGAGAASVAVYVLGSAGRGVSPDRLIMAGAAITAVLISFVSAILLLNPQTFNVFRFWDVGSLGGRDMGVVRQLAPFILVGIVIALALARSLNALALGDQAAKALGTNIGLTRIIGVIAVTLLCGAATAGVGPIGFVGLAVPYAARLIVGPDQRWVLPYSAVLAPILLIGSDVLGRVVNSPEELQVGIVTAFVGAPVFVLLCRRRKVAKL